MIFECIIIVILFWTSEGFLTSTCMPIVQNTNPNDLNLERARAEREVLSLANRIGVSNVNFTHLTPYPEPFCLYLMLSIRALLDGRFHHRKSNG